MFYLAGAIIVLIGFWLVLSGMFTGFLITLGVISSVAIALFSYSRLVILDDEGHPLHLMGAALTYWPWLVWQIILSAWSVSKLIVNPKLPITPTMVRVPASQRTAVGRVTYANSITLTPGTISVDLDDSGILVHALQREGIADLNAGEMNRRVTRFEHAES